ncbi:hypothetical protein SLEP1_g17433 [Rubroshorea leprosula]|uniref:Uncharacterized protein n=1 Tax=Rubroshorea leprosula TaxID=152421 RepID=A0AAV5J3C5_9ROSI|nr:hypothetical protein SLEP1_g17433 [Rubroshorea leprosula]
MEYSPARSSASSSNSVDGGSKPESHDQRCAEYKCGCGLTPAIRTSFTVQNMGMRFRCCPKKKDACPYFHFMPGEQRMQGRALELILILKGRESKAVKEKDKLKQEMAALLQEKG